MVRTQAATYGGTFELMHELQDMGILHTFIDQGSPALSCTGCVVHWMMHAHLHNRYTQARLHACERNQCNGICTWSRRGPSACMLPLHAQDALRHSAQDRQAHEPGMGQTNQVLAALGLKRHLA